MSYGIGVMGFSFGYSGPAASEEPTTVLVASRSILPNGAIEQDDDGNFVSMSDSQQRVWVLLQKAKREFPAYISIDFEEQVSAVVRKYLKIMTDSASPSITLGGRSADIPQIIVQTSINQAKVTVNFIDNHTNEPASVTL